MAPKKRSAAKAAPSAAQASPAAKRAKPTLEQRVAKCIQDNFKGWKSDEVYVRKVNDMTIAEVLTRDIPLRDSGELVMGANYFRILKDARRPPSDPIACLKIKEGSNEVINSSLMQAIVATKRKRKDYAPLKAYLGAAPEPNHTECVGVLWIALLLDPENEAHHPICMQVARWAARLSLKSKYEYEIDLCFTYFDRTLMETKKQSSKEEPEVFCTIHMAALGLVMDLADLQAILEAAGDYTKVVDQLTRVVQCSQVGHMCWSFALLQNLAALVAAYINEAIAEELVSKHLTEDLVAAAKLKILGGCENLANISLLPLKRSIKFNYKGAQVPAPVASVGDEVHLGVDAFVRGLASQLEYIPELWCEDLVVQRPEKLDGTMDKAMTLGMAAARNRCKRDFDEAGCESGDVVRATCQSGARHWLVTDPGFQVEVCMIQSVAGPGSETRLLDLALPCMASAEKDVSPEECLQALSRLRKTKSFVLASLTAQAKLEIVIDWVSKIMDHRPPDFTNVASDDAALQKLRKQLSYFMRHEEQGGASAPGATVFGAAAAKQKLLATRAKSETGGLTLADVSFLRSWQFLLSDEDAKTAVDLLQAADAAQPAQIRAKARATKSKAGKAKKVDQAVAEAMAVFS